MKPSSVEIPLYRTKSRTISLQQRDGELLHHDEIADNYTAIHTYACRTEAREALGWLENSGECGSVSGVTRVLVDGNPRHGFAVEYSSDDRDPGFYFFHHDGQAAAVEKFYLVIASDGMPAVLAGRKPQVKPGSIVVELDILDQQFSINGRYFPIEQPLSRMVLTASLGAAVLAHGPLGNKYRCLVAAGLLANKLAPSVKILLLSIAKPHSQPANVWISPMPARILEFAQSFDMDAGF